MDSKDYQNAIFELLAKRKPGATICPSEAARAVSAINRAGSNWRDAMPAVRSEAAELVALGRLEITLSGEIVDISTAKGAIRLRLPPQR